MDAKFYKEQVIQQVNNDNFKKEQSEFGTRSKIIEEVRDEYKLYIDHYLQKEQKEGVDAPLFDYIDANGDQEKVITYINYELKDNANDLSKYDLSQLKNLKTILKKQDYKEKVHVFPNNVNFGIIGGLYKEKNGEQHKIIMQQVKKLRKNRYKLLLKKEGSKRIEKFEIHYDGSDYVSIYDQFGTRLGREIIKKDNTIFIEGNKYRKEQYQTEGELTINTPKETIELNLIFVA